MGPRTGAPLVPPPPGPLRKLYTSVMSNTEAQSVASIDIPITPGRTPVRSGPPPKRARSGRWLARPRRGDPSARHPLVRLPGHDLAVDPPDLDVEVRADPE